MTPVFRTYFRLHCVLDEPAVEALWALCLLLETKKTSEITVRAYEKVQGTSFSPPYIALDFAVEHNIYSLAEFVRKTILLFDFLADNEIEIYAARKLIGVNANYFVNFNSHTDQQRPVFNLTNEQMKLLARLNCALEFDSYFLF